MNPRRVEIRIDEIALTGVPAHQRDAVVAAFRAELGRTLRDPAITAPPASLAVEPAADGGAALGTAAGRALGRGLEG